MLKRVWFALVLTLLTGSGLFLLDAKPAAAVVPQGFEDRLVATVGDPTALTFTPDQRLLVTTQTGLLKVYENGSLRQDPALDLRGKVCSNGERGLLGVALDPDFASNGYVYVYYTFNKFGVCPVKDPANPRNPVNRVSRFVMDGNTADPASEKVLINNIPSPNGNHNAGDLHFGKDGYLYVSVGDGGCDYAQPTKCQPENDASRDRNVLLGKILRLDPAGATLQDRIPPGNPYTGPNSGICADDGRTTAGTNCRETFARGLRNPFRMAFDPDAAGTSFRIDDVGGANWEEINVGKKGADYGWNICEGRHDNDSRPGSLNCSAPPLTPPIHEYNHNTGCSSVTGGAFVPDGGSWPDNYDNAYLFGDYVCGRIFALKPRAGGGFARTAFAYGLGQGGPVATAFGPYRGGTALYYTTYATGEGQVRRIAYAADFPTAEARVDQAYGDLTMDFDGSESRDPQNDQLTYEWDFDGDGTVDSEAADPGPYTYARTARHTVKLRVRDSEGLEGADTITVFPGDTPPEPTIESPTADALFRVGQKVTVSGSATDAEDDADGNAETAPTLEWRIVRHHNGSHTHPYTSGTGSVRAFVAPAPEDLFSTNPAGNYLEVRLTATDSLGLSKTVSREIRPRTTRLGFSTKPGGLRVRVNGRDFVAPRSLLSWENARLNLYAPDQRRDGKRWEFRSWSDSRARYHTITTPVDARTYVARFRRG
jgi:glucose/arabinose dehydrogenase